MYFLLKNGAHVHCYVSLEGRISEIQGEIQNNSSAMKWTMEIQKGFLENSICFPIP